MRKPLEAPPEHIIPGAGADAEVSRPEPTTSGALSSVRKPVVLLDLWHVKHRLIAEARQTHGAFPAYCSSLAKAFAIPDPRAMEELRQAVARLNPTLEPLEVDKQVHKSTSDW